MNKKPKLEVKRYHGDGRNDWGIFRADRMKPICAGISKAHAEHLKWILGRAIELPESIEPISDWYDYEEIVEVDENGKGKVNED